MFRVQTISLHVRTVTIAIPTNNTKMSTIVDSYSLVRFGNGKEPMPLARSRSQNDHL